MSRTGNESRFDNLYFDVLSTGEEELLIRIHFVAPLKEGNPAILQELLDLLSRNDGKDDVIKLTTRYPQHSNILVALNMVLSQVQIIPGSVSGIHWSTDKGYSIHIQAKRESLKDRIVRVVQNRSRLTDVQIWSWGHTFCGGALFEGPFEKTERALEELVQESRIEIHGGVYYLPSKKESDRTITQGAASETP